MRHSLTSTGELFRREHYLPLAGPRDFTDREIAVWIFALCLHRDGRSDAQAAYDITLNVGVATLNPATLQPRMRIALAVALYLCATGGLGWPLPRLVGAFRMNFREASDAVEAVAITLASGAPDHFLEGLNDVSLAVRKQMTGGV
jgi:hypothetical protein